MAQSGEINRRTFVGMSAALMASGVRPMVAQSPAARADPIVIRGNWAGIQIEAEGRTLLVDPLDDAAVLGNGWSTTIVPTVPQGTRCDVLVTHLHNDHYDRTLLRRLWADPASRGRVVIPDALSSYVASEGFRVVPAVLGIPVTVGPFLVTAVPAVDGFGELQVSYVIDVAGRRFFHGGDTIWHGKWWEIGRAYGPFDVAFLPINGAIIPQRTGKARIPHTLTGEQAVAAALALRARSLVPIHHGLHDPGRYEEDPDVMGVTISHGRQAGVRVAPHAAGSLVQLPVRVSDDTR